MVMMYAINSGAVVKDWRNPSVYLNDLTSILSTRPDVVLIYWDSDCIMDHDLSETAATQLRTNYTANLRWLVETILDSTTFLSIGGPGRKQKSSYSHSTDNRS